MITVMVDEITPCLKDIRTGDIVETECIRVRRKSFLSKFNEKTGWYTNWADLVDENEIYALVLKGTTDIQGLVAVRLDVESEEVFVPWMCTSPENNKIINGENVRYAGVGGHLFAIAMQRSMDWGKGGFMYGFAANEKLLQHYQEVFGAMYVGILHEYHFLIDEACANIVIEEYDYDWTDEEI